MTELTDEQVVGRMRAALDEAHATEPAVDVVTRSAGTDRREVLRWVGIAAAGVVVLGAVGWAVTRPDASTPAATLPEPPAPTVAPAPTTTAPVAAAPWFVLASPDLVPGTETTEEWSADNEMFQAWEVVNADDRGVITAVVVTDPASPTPEGDYLTEEVLLPDLEGRLWMLTPNKPDGTPNDWGFEAHWLRDSGEVWRFFDVGLSKGAFSEAVVAATSGSGVPIVIDDPSVRLLGVAPSSGINRVQIYTSTTTDGAEVELRVGGLPLLDALSGPTLTPVTVAGRPGWQTANPFNAGGRVVVVWDAGGGAWGQMQVPASMAERAPGLIAALAEAPGEPATPVPAPTG